MVSTASATNGVFPNANRAGNIALVRQLLGMPAAPSSSESDGAEAGHTDEKRNTCPYCGGRMVIIETFEPGCQPQLWPIPAIGLTAHDRRARVTILRRCASDAGMSRVAPTLSRRQPSAPPSTAKTQIARRNLTFSSAARAADSTVAVLARPPSQSEIKKSNQTLALNPHRSTPASVRTPPRFPPSRLFGRLPPCIP